MSPADRLPAIEVTDLRKAAPGPEPLRIERLVVAPGDRIVVSGLDAGMAEMLMHLITGAALPDAGDVRVGGRDTRAIATDTEWLQSLDQFGIVTGRAVLLDGMSVAANLALPLTLAIEPMPADVHDRVLTLSREVGLAAGRLDERASALLPAERVRVHLARALAVGPRLLLLEHPTASLDRPDDARAFGATLREVSETRRLGWLAVSDDVAFARASGGRHLRVDPVTGALEPARAGWLARMFGSSR